MDRKLLAVVLLVCACVLIPAAAHDAVVSVVLPDFGFITGDGKAAEIFHPSDDQILPPFISADFRLKDAVSVNVTKLPEYDGVALSITVDPTSVALNRPLQDGDGVLVVTGFAYNPEYLSIPGALPLSPGELRTAGIPYKTVLVTPLNPGYPSVTDMTFPDIQSGDNTLNLTLLHNATVQTGVFVSVREKYQGLYQS